MKNLASRLVVAAALVILDAAWTQDAWAQAAGGAISGERIDVTTEREAPKALSAETATVSAPFGSNLFTGNFNFVLCIFGPSGF